MNFEELFAPPLPECQGCGAKNAKIYFQGKDLMQGVAGNFTVWQCQTCHTIFIAPLPVDMSLFYPADYHPYNAGKVDNPLAQKNYARGLEKQVSIVQRLSGLTTGLVLDVGCARGDFLSTLKQRGWRVLGQEMNATIAQAARLEHGIDVIGGDFQQAALPQGAFDLITFWDVLEHLPAPRAALRKAHTLVKPGGWLVFSIPNPNSWEAGVFGKFWAGWDVPRHLWVFHPGVVEKILNEEGWGNVSSLTRRGRYFLFDMSLAFWIQAAHPGSKALRLLQRMLQSWAGRALLFLYYQVAERINKGSILIFAAQRQ